MTEFDLSKTIAQDEAQLKIKHPTTGEETTWIWTFYGPAHPNTIAVANRAIKSMMNESKAQQEARINGKKWKAEDQSFDDMRMRGVENIVARTKEFTPVKMGAETITFSADAVKKLLLDRHLSWLFKQVTDFLEAEENFIQPSAQA